MPIPTVSSFGDKLFNPLSIGRAKDDLVDFGGSKRAKLAFFVASFVLGFFTAGFFHLSHELLHHYYWKGRVTKSNPSNTQVLITDPYKTAVVKKAKPNFKLGTVPDPDKPKPSPRTDGPRNYSPTTGRVIKPETTQTLTCKYSQGQFSNIKNFLNKEETNPSNSPSEYDGFSGDDDLFDMLAANIEGMTRMVRDQQNNSASQACSVICLKAVLSFFNTGLPNSENDMYELIYEGIIEYFQKVPPAMRKKENQLIFMELFEQLSDEETQEIAILKPKMDDELGGEKNIGGIDSGQLGALTVAGYYNGSASHIFSFINVVNQRAIESKGRTCAVLTTTTSSESNATRVIMFDEKRRVWLFDSHGSSAKEHGAILELFDNTNDLSSYITQEIYKKGPGTFTLNVLNKQIS